MANNRAFLVCPPCKEWYFLGKHFGSPWGWGFDEKGEQFVTEHFYCASPGNGLEVGSHFRLMYEFSTDKEFEIDYREYKDGCL